MHRAAILLVPGIALATECLRCRAASRAVGHGAAGSGQELRGVPAGRFRLPTICLAADRWRVARRGGIAERGRQRRGRHRAGRRGRCRYRRGERRRRRWVPRSVRAPACWPAARSAPTMPLWPMAASSRLYDVGYAQCMTAHGNTRAGAADRLRRLIRIHRIRTLYALPVSLSLSRLLRTGLVCAISRASASAADGVGARWGPGWGWGAVGLGRGEVGGLGHRLA